MKLRNSLLIPLFIMFLLCPEVFSKQLNSFVPDNKSIPDAAYFSNYYATTDNKKNITQNIADKQVNDAESEFLKTKKALEETQRVLDETKKQLDQINSVNSSINNNPSLNNDKYFENFDSMPDKYDTSIDIKHEAVGGGPEDQVTSVEDMINSASKQSKQDLVPKKEFENTENIKQEPTELQATDSKGDVKKYVAKTDTPIQKKSLEIELLLRADDKDMLDDLRVLWQAAVEKSNTIRLAIQKLSNPNEADQQKQGAIQKVLTPLAGLAPLAMMGSTTGAQASGAMLGGGLLGTLTSDVDKRFNQDFMKVTDYDLIMLAKKIDELQEVLVIAYYDYRNALTSFEETERATVIAKENYEKYKNSNDIGALTASDAFYREALQTKVSAEQEFLLARAGLEQITNNDAIVFIEDLKKNPELLKKFEQEIQQLSEQPKSNQDQSTIKDKSKTDKKTAKAK